MNWTDHFEWQPVEGLPDAKIARYCGNTDTGHAREHWPRIAMLDLSHEQFDEFHKNPLEFTLKYDMYPEQPILWKFSCSTPARVKGAPRPDPKTRWTVIILHGHKSAASSAAMPHEFLQPSDGSHTGPD